MKNNIVNPLIVGIFGIVLGACSTNPPQTINAGMPTGQIKSSAPLNGNGFGSGGGMMGWEPGPGGIPILPPAEKSYGVVTFDREDGGHAQSRIDERGTTFFILQSIPYTRGFSTGEGECFPVVSYLTVGDSGTVRFTRKGKTLLARIVVRTLSGKIVSAPAQKLSPSCSKESQAQKVENSSETILTRLVRVVPGKSSSIVLGKSTVTLFLDKNFPVDKVPAYPKFTSFDNGLTPYLPSEIGMMGGMGGLGRD